MPKNNARTPCNRIAPFLQIQSQCRGKCTAKLNQNDLRKYRNDNNHPKDPILVNALENIAFIIHFSRINFIENLHPYKDIKHHRQMDSTTARQIADSLSASR